MLPKWQPPHSHCHIGRVKNIKKPLDISTQSITILTRKSKVTYEDYGYANSLYFCGRNRDSYYIMDKITDTNTSKTVGESLPRGTGEVRQMAAEILPRFCNSGIQTGSGIEPIIYHAPLTICPTCSKMCILMTGNSECLGCIHRKEKMSR